MLTEVTKAREQVTNIQLPPDILTNPDAMKKFQDAQATLGGALGRLMAVVERYPDIKSGQNFLALQNELAATENRIAIARGDYIGAVRAYNTEITTIPGRWWKSVLYPQSKEMATFDIKRKSRRFRRSISTPSRNAVGSRLGRYLSNGWISGRRSVPGITNSVSHTRSDCCAYGAVWARYVRSLRTNLFRSRWTRRVAMVAA